jgi:hypothetical protein
MENEECKMQNVKWKCTMHNAQELSGSAFFILHFSFRVAFSITEQGSRAV